MNILLTGASRGIGAATLDALTASGHRVAGHSTKGGDGLIAGDLADPASPSLIWEAALEQLGGRIDVLVNNAGIYEGVADDASDEEWHAAWQRTLTVNLQASADLCRLAVRHFRQHGGGRIVNVASRAAFRGDSPQHWHYAASKSAMIGMTKIHRPRLCGGEHPRLRGRAGLHRVGDDRGISAGTRRGGDRRRHPARPGHQYRRGCRSDPLAGDRRARRLDRIGHRSQWSQLCSLGPPSSRHCSPRPPPPS